MLRRSQIPSGPKRPVPGCRPFSFQLRLVNTAVCNDDEEHAGPETGVEPELPFAAFFPAFFRFGAEETKRGRNSTESGRVEKR